MNNQINIFKENGKLIDNKIATVKKCTKDDMNSILNLQNESMQNMEYLIPFTVEELEDVFKNQDNVYGCYLEDKLIAFINFTMLSKNDINNLGLKIGLKVNVGNVDGVIVHPIYLGNGIQRFLMEYIEKIAKENNIKHIVSDVSPDNKYSLNNLLKFGYKVEGEFNKKGKFEKSIVHKIL